MQVLNVNEVCLLTIGPTLYHNIHLVGKIMRSSALETAASSLCILDFATVVPSFGHCENC